MFTKIAPVCPDAGAPDTYFVLNHLSDGKAILTSQKGVNQPLYSYYHQTALTGGIAAICNAADSTWTPPATFPSIDANENREDIVFAFGAQLLMLVYSRYENFEFKKLYHWDSSKNEWLPGPLDLETSSQFPTERAELVYGWDASSGALLAAVTDRSTGTVYIDRIEVNASGSGKVRNVTKAENLIPMGHVTNIATDGAHIFVLAGVEGCGFMWEPQKLHVFNLSTKVWSSVEAKGDSGTPPFGFSGPRSDFFTKSKQWIMIGGSQRSGMTGSDFIREVWSLNLSDASKPKWEKMGIKIPDEVKGEYACYASDFDKQLYVYDPQNGLFKGTL